MGFGTCTPQGQGGCPRAPAQLWGRATVQVNKVQEFCLAKKSFGLDGSTSNDLSDKLRENTHPQFAVIWKRRS